MTFRDRMKVSVPNANIRFARRLQEEKYIVTTEDWVYLTQDDITIHNEYLRHGHMDIFLDGPPHLKVHQSKWDEIVNTVYTWRRTPQLRIPYTRWSKTAEDQWVALVEEAFRECGGLH